ncbi:MAG: hypothetical protein P9L92_18980 [Candidatus Electryonea clarkiae]|nr:hypothetical protein [Candidatus Electryonea clarkiae]MDP8285714.1 hypothetical protein [Candidatus Electryonea clarkiae]
MEEHTKRIQNRLRQNYRKKVFTLVRSLEVTSSTLQEISPALTEELLFVAKSFQEKQKKFFETAGNLENLPLQQVISLLDFMPPDRALLRFDLDRLSKAYDDICFLNSEENIQMYKIGESACERGDHDTGMNILKQIIAKDRLHFPALLVYGHGMLVIRKDYTEAIRIFEQAFHSLRHEHSVHFRLLLLELIAMAHESNHNYASACRTLKRLFTLEADTPSINYLIARNYALNSQSKEALYSLETALATNPEYLALTLVDQGFKNIRKEIQDKFIKMNDEWHDHATALFVKIKDISRIVRIYGLHESENSIKMDIENIVKMEKSIKNDGCLSRYRETILDKMKYYIPAYPDSVVEGLEDLAIDRRYEISDYNQYISDQVGIVQSKMKKIAGIVWSGLSLIIILTLSLSGTPIFLAFLGIIAALPIGFITYVVLERFMESKYALQKVGIDAVKQVRTHQRDVSWVKADLLSRISKEGWM